MNKQNLSIGFIGAGRVGFTLGRYFYENGFSISGYYSKTYEHASEAASFTSSKSYVTIKELVEGSNMIFISVPDARIYDVYLQLREYDLKDKILCHCSGSLSAKIFEGIDALEAYGYSIHPIFAINDKMNSYKDISKAFFTIEGSNSKMYILEEMFKELGNGYQIIDATHKHLYHASLVMSSNLVVGLYQMATEMLEKCGFEPQMASIVLEPLFLNNAKSICEKGSVLALTGPVDRNDVITIENHQKAMKICDQDVNDVYTLLSKELVKIAKHKYPDRDYEQLEKILDKE